MRGSIRAPIAALQRAAASAAAGQRTSRLGAAKLAALRSSTNFFSMILDSAPSASKCYQINQQKGRSNSTSSLPDLESTFSLLRLSSQPPEHTKQTNRAPSVLHIHSEPHLPSFSAASSRMMGPSPIYTGEDSLCSSTLFTRHVRHLVQNHSPLRNLRRSTSAPPSSHTDPSITASMSVANRPGTNRSYIKDVSPPTDTDAPKLSFGVAASYSAKQKRYDPATNTFVFNPYLRVKPPTPTSTPSPPPSPTPSPPPELAISEPEDPTESTSKDSSSPSSSSTTSDRKKGRPDTGQDAFFISRINDSNGVALGVADGVGGYSHYGIDSAEFAHTLCENMAAIAHDSPTARLHPRTLLNDAYTQLIEDGSVRGGASTACLGTARTDGVLMVANLGDSGFVILRGGRVVHASAPQTHAFNTPYQLSVVPRAVLDQSRMFGGDFLRDGPRDAHVSTHELRHGDVVVFATDGVWDNLAVMDVLRIAGAVMLEKGAWARVDTTADNRPSGAIVPGEKLGELVGPEAQVGLHTTVARAIAGAAKSASLNRRVDGPFAKEVKRLMPEEHFSGGKRDDICVVALVAVDETLGKKA